MTDIPKVLCLVILTLLTAVPVVAQRTLSTGIDQHPGSEDFTNQRNADPLIVAEVTMRYAELSTLGLNSRRALYETLSNEMKRDLWLLHIERFAEANQELNDEQRTVIEHARALLEYGAITYTAPEEPGRESWIEALSLLEQRARSVFSKQQARSLLFELGGPEAGLLDSQTNLDSCTCSTESDWCDWITNPDPYCKAGGRTCRRTHGCGTFWQYDCNGMCSA